MVLRREKLKKRLLQSQLELIEVQGEESLLLDSAGVSGDPVMLGGDDDREEEEEEELESLEEEEEGPCSPPSVRQTR